MSNLDLASLRQTHISTDQQFINLPVEEYDRIMQSAAAIVGPSTNDD